ncbi:unnamed protein product [Enterobius vermicularis]|uniref:PRA1 family protein n=1 Tax=Enterobius vermicularis TaxID=51028 RepID=A0A0N4V7H0_ENTVE|nr:unnamed protein product [Enterobius vermicularis]
MGDGVTLDGADINWKFTEDVQIPPFRNMDEFILGRARFQLPTFTNFPKWNNRILTNLLYFQTNYFVIMIAVILVSCAVQAPHVLFGLSALVTLIAALFLSISKNPSLEQIRSDHPLLTLISILVALYYFIYVLTSVCVVLFIILMPTLLVLIHASLRLRDPKAKINRLWERTGMSTTVMSRLLQLMNVDLKSL